MEKYRVEIGGRITKHEIVKETDKTISYKRVFGQDRFRIEKEHKESNWQNWFNTFQDARDYLIGECERKIQGHLKAIEYQNEQIEKIKQLKEF